MQSSHHSYSNSQYCGQEPQNTQNIAWNWHIRCFTHQTKKYRAQRRKNAFLQTATSPWYCSLQYTDIGRRHMSNKKAIILLLKTVSYLRISAIERTQWLFNQPYHRNANIGPTEGKSRLFRWSGSHTHQYTKTKQAEIVRGYVRLP